METIKTLGTELVELANELSGQLLITTSDICERCNYVQME